MIRLFARWALYLAGVLVGLYVLAVVVGWMLPVTMTTTNSITINRPPENVWWILTDYNNAANWHPQYKESVMLSVPGEKPIRRRVMYTDGYTAEIEVVEETFPKHLVERILNPDRSLPFGGTWTVDIVPQERSSRVTVQARGELYNVLDRLIVHLFVHPDAEVDKILKALKARVEATTTM